MKVKILIALLALLVLIAIALPVTGQLEGITSLNGLHLSQTSFGTATPQLMIQNGGSNKSIEIRNSLTTPVWSVNANGSTTGSLGETNSSNLVVSAPTAIGTATPAVLINNAGVSRLLEVQDGGVTIFSMNNGGSSSFAAPTAIATANPALVVDSAGVSNILEVRDAATPVFTVRQSGTVQGLVLKYGTAGEQLVTGTDLITGTGTASHGLTTVTFCMATLGQDPTAGAGDAAMVTVAVSANVCTLKVWQDDFVTAASETSVDVHWLVIGTP